MFVRSLLAGLRLLRLRRGEWPVAVLALVVIGVFQWLLISKFYVLFADYSPENWRVFMRNFHMSGFDPITYGVVTDWNIGYNILRHPLLPFLLYPFYLLNQLLWSLTGVNCVQFLVGAVLAFCAFYSFLFLYRILHELVGVGRQVALLLVMLFFGFAYILIATFVPDHFVISLMLILATLYIAGLKLKAHHTFSVAEIVVMFVLTAGVTLSNGVITGLALLFVNGRRAFSRPMVVSLLVASVVLVGLGLGVNALLDDPGDQDVAGWLDTSLPRVQTVVENFFGESLQLHRRHLLGDVLVRRPVFVTYTWSAQYAVEAVLVLLFVCGVVAGRKSKFLWLTMSCFFYAVLLHLTLGFAINEVYIMACHWAFAMPIAMGYLFVDTRKWLKMCLFIIILSIVVYLWMYHGTLLYRYLTWPLRLKF